MCFRLRGILLVIFTVFMESEKVFGNKYCAFELDGEAKYYMCPRNEYCCNFGCCVNLAFQFYQLWYYWLLIIIMFMICSGGGWWYRFCRQTDTTSTYPTTTNSNNTMTGRELHNRNMTEMTRRGRLTSSAQRSNRLNNNNNNSNCINNINNNTNNSNHQFYIQQLWKGPSNHHQNLPPSYYSSNHYAIQDTQFYPECPYHQLYGPPPSYDSIIQIADPNSSSSQTSCSLVPAAPQSSNELNASTGEPFIDGATQTNDVASTPHQSENSCTSSSSNMITNAESPSASSCDEATCIASTTGVANKIVSCSSTNSLAYNNENLHHKAQNIPESQSTPIFNIIPSTSKIKVDDETKISPV